MTNFNYYSVTGPAGNVIANFGNEHDAEQFRDRIINVRLEQLERIQSVLTESEYRGEKAFRSCNIGVAYRTVVVLSSQESSQIPDEQLVDGNFLIPS